MLILGYNLDVHTDGPDSLGKLEPARMDASSRTGCLDNTRTDVLTFIREWVDTQNSEHRILWLHGPPGSGKSAIATSIASGYSDSLGAFLFFDRRSPESNDPAITIRTLAYLLGSSNPKLRTFICTTVESNPNIRLSSFSHQFQTLIIDPLASIDIGPSSIVIVIDALDECGTPKSREILLSVLVEQSAKLPSAIRIVITSRPEKDISDAFKSQPHILPYELDIASQANSDDIMTYFRYRMGQMRIQRADLQLSADWPGEAMLRRLVQKASGLFVWASTASEFVNGYDPIKRLRTILDQDSTPKAEAPLDDLYTTALESIQFWDDEDFVADFRVIMEVVLIARQPLSSTSIDALLYLPEDRPSKYRISFLACVLQQNPAVCIMHSSFAEFLMSKDRCKRDIWLFARSACHSNLALQCLKRLDAVLEFNMSKITLSDPIPDATFPDDISYACLYWAEHVCAIEDNANLIVDRLCDFLYRHLMHWFEATSILKKSRSTISLLGRLLNWVSVSYYITIRIVFGHLSIYQVYAASQTRLSELVRDAHHFARVFSGFIEEHPLLVYVAALPFSPIHTTLYKTFHNSSLHLSVAGGFQQSWSPALLLLTGHQKEVGCVAISSDGTRIVSGSGDRTIRLWDAASGAEVPPTMEGHRRNVQAVSFSPDGTRIVSGSHDNTIRVWDVISGALAFPALRGHVGKVTSVVFSPDGTRIISGSEDGTVRVWDAASGVQVFPELRHKRPVTCVVVTHDGTRIISGSQDQSIQIWDANSGIPCPSAIPRHDEWILSVAASPNGDRIASGSEDSTIRVWDVTTGVRLLALQGHRSRIQGLAFSPNGTRLASCSDDKTIRIWDATTGQPISVLQGHHNYVQSVAYSPDGNWLVSGSGDKTIRIWDTTLSANTSVQRPFSISCVTFSPDGQRVASGSFDETIRIWDTASGVQVKPLLTGHHGAISSVAFSPDGTRIVSSSGDKTIRVWNVITGEQIFANLQRPDDSVLSVAFSSDGSHIVSGLEEGNIQTWDSSSGTIVPVRNQEHHQPRQSSFADNSSVTADLNDKLIIAQDTFSYPTSSAIDIDKDRWIIDSTTNQKLSKLPPVLDVKCAAKWNKSLVVGASNGGVLIIHFPTLP